MLVFRWLLCNCKSMSLSKQGVFHTAIKTMHRHRAAIIWWPSPQMDAVCWVAGFVRAGCGLANVHISRDIQMCLSPMVPPHYAGKWAVVALVAVLDKALVCFLPSCLRGVGGGMGKQRPQTGWWNRVRNVAISWSGGWLLRLFHCKEALDALRRLISVGNGSVYWVCTNAFDLVNLGSAFKQITS